jgi:hypothetical protein
MIEKKLKAVNDKKRKEEQGTEEEDEDYTPKGADDSSSDSPLTPSMAKQTWTLMMRTRKNPTHNKPLPLLIMRMRMWTISRWMSMLESRWLLPRLSLRL